MTLTVPTTRRVVTLTCPVCGRWNDPTGGLEAHSAGCPEEGQPYPGAEPQSWTERARAHTLPAKVLS